MKKLQLKDIVGYLPYRLKFFNDGGSEEDDTIYEIQGLSTFYGVEYSLSNGCGTCEHIECIKPILRPLSDLTKPIKVEGYNEGEEFVPIVKLNTIFNYIESIYIFFNDYKLQIEFDKGECNSHTIWANVIQLLYQWHFDINGLCDRGLAIDMNTLITE